MAEYCLQSHLDGFYYSFHGTEKKPVIGITSNYSEVDACLRDRYYKQVVDAGGVPVIIPPISDRDVITNTLDSIDGLILSGGGDYNPLWCGEQPSPNLRNVNAERDLPEMLLTRLAYHRQIPMLGICRGIQTLAMALEGKVAQDISELDATVKHSQDAAREERTHSVSIVGNSVLASIYNNVDVLFVNSFHHQAVKDCGTHFCVSAVSEDGLIEAIESSEHKNILGVQWHPEWLGESGLPLFKWLVGSARLFSDAKRLHDNVLTLDSHCDTPMLFPQGVRLERREKAALVDLHKMTEGRLDVVTMVAYLPQPKHGQIFPGTVPFNVNTPKEYADLIFDRIEGMVSDNSKYVSLARTCEDLLLNKREGRKSIMLGVENGLALDGDLANVKHFADRGVVYITLCHNGDNDICGSAKGEGAHEGVTPFGEKVIQEMNNRGIMVDMSHASEKSFYDAIDISSKPIVCSHSCCRSLCGTPRNLTDEQMRALAKTGGVMQVTLYHGFLRSEGQATVIDAINHLEHAIDVMGIDHVGVGTDFDGDGGVPGIADASEMINFTMQLLRRRYSMNDIERIWGGNWLSVLTQNRQI